MVARLHTVGITLNGIVNCMHYTYVPFCVKPGVDCEESDVVGCLFIKLVAILIYAYLVCKYSSQISSPFLVAY